MTFKESDWKRFQELQKIALDRYCRKALAELQTKLGDTTHSARQRYTDISNFVNEHNKELALLFDDPRRGTAQRQLLGMTVRNLLTDDEIGTLSDDLQDWLRISAETSE